MKFAALSIGLLAVLAPLASAWSKEDHEIFRVRDEITTHEGPDVTFYSFLGVEPSASQDDISRAYRKKSRSLHPDKVKQQLAAERARKSGKKSKKGVNVAKAPSASEVKAAVKRASDRQARLSIVANILRGADRARYDHFLAHGFPVWKGTGYYYNRYRPGLGTVVAGVFVFAGGAAHYLALYMGWKRQREFVDRYIRFARSAAWGDGNMGLGIPGVDGAAAPAPAIPDDDDPDRAVPVNRKMRRMQERDAKREAAKDGAGSGRRGRRGGTSTPSSSRAPAPATSPASRREGGPTGAKKRVVAENGKVLVVDSLGDVYLEQEDEDGNVGEYLLDPNELPQPTIHDTAIVRLPRWIYQLTVGRVVGQSSPSGDDSEEARDPDAESPDEDSEPGKRTPSTDSTDGFELLDKSVDELDKDKAKATGQKQGKANKRKSKKR